MFNAAIIKLKGDQAKRAIHKLKNPNLANRLTTEFAAKKLQFYVHLLAVKLARRRGRIEVPAEK